VRAGAFCWRAACQRRGGNPPAPAFRWRGKCERGSSDFLAAAGSSSWHGGHCIALLPPFCPDHMSTSRSAFPNVWSAPPTLVVLLSALLVGHNEPVRVGVRSKARPIDHGDGPRCRVPRSNLRSLKDHSVLQSPEQGGGCYRFTKTSRGLLASLIHIGAPFILLPECHCSEWLRLCDVCFVSILATRPPHFRRRRGMA
jgi:hypothetical protein